MFRPGMLVLLVLCQNYALAEWVWRNPLPNAFSWERIAVAEDRIYLVGRSKWASSTDGVDWEYHEFGGPAQFHDMTVTPEGLVAAGWSGSDSRPADPLRYGVFASRNESSFALLGELPEACVEIEYGNGVFLAAYQGVFFSREGVNWSAVQATPFYARVDLLFGAGKFLITWTNGIYASADGENWSKSLEGPFEKLTYHEGVYAAAEAGSVSYSRNAMEWERYPVQTPSSIAAIAHGPPGTIVLGFTPDGKEPRATFSKDKTNWSALPLPFSNHSTDAVFFKDRFVIAGREGLIAHSTNGLDWTVLPEGPQASLNRMSSGQNKFLALSSSPEQSGGIWSTNGIDWQAVEFEEPTPGVRGVTFAEDTFVAVGLGGSVAFSGDGMYWERGSNNSAQDLFEVTHSPEGFVAVGRGVVVHSEDGKSWKEVSSLGHVLYDIAYGNGVYVVCGVPMWMAAMRSTDLRTWTPLPPPIAHGYHVEFGNGRFVLATVDGTYLSSDGVDWVRGRRSAISFLQYSDGLFCAYSGGYLQPGVPRLISRDGVRWQELPPLAGDGPASHHQGRLFVTGGGGTVIELRQFGFLDFLRNDEGVQVIPFHTVDSDATVQVSSDLLEWADVDASDQASVQVPADAAKAFYRLVLEGDGGRTRSDEHRTSE